MGSLFLRAMQGVVGLSVLATLSAPLPAVQAQLEKKVTTLNLPRGGSESRDVLRQLVEAYEEKGRESKSKGERREEIDYYFFYINGTNKYLVALVDVKGPKFLSLLYFNRPDQKNKAIRREKNLWSLVEGLSAGTTLGTIRVNLTGGVSKTVSANPPWTRSNSFKNGGMLNPSDRCKLISVSGERGDKAGSKSSHKLTCTGAAEGGEVIIQHVSLGKR